jgi:hypothetical protein
VTVAPAICDQRRDRLHERERSDHTATGDGVVVEKPAT